MYNLQLKKNGILVTKIWDNKLHDYIECEIKDEDLIFYIDDFICLDKEITLKDLFSLISKNIKLWSIFTSCLFLDKLIEEVMLPINPQGEDILFLELSWEVKKHKQYIFDNTYFYGVGIDGTYAIEFTSLNKLAYLPLVINEKYIIQDNEKEILVTSKLFTLGEFVKGIIFELSFIGPPRAKKEFCKKLYNMDDMKTISWEDAEKEFEEIDKKYKRSCKICGNDARSKMFNKPHDICEECFVKVKEN